MSHQEQLWIIAYDIEDDAVRRQVASLLEEQGQRVQYSVFECWLLPEQRRQLKKTLQRHLEPGDQLRWYPLCQGCSRKVEWQGRGQPSDNPEFYLS